MRAINWNVQRKHTYMYEMNSEKIKGAQNLQFYWQSEMAMNNIEKTFCWNLVGSFVVAAKLNCVELL